MKLSKYKGKKLKILLANDNDFQLLIISTSLKGMSCIQNIDQARNG